jgi:HlyD family secretion protein
MKRLTMIFLGLSTLAVSGWAASATHGSAKAVPEAVPLAKEPAEAATIAAPGRIEALSESVDVSAEITGRLERVLVDENDQVRAGQTIATIDAADARARLASAEANIGIARADLARLVNGARPEERREADAQKLQADSALAQAATERQRRQRLFVDGAISREEFERADRDWRVAQARVDELTQRAAVVSADARDDERARATAAVALAEAQVAEARAQLDKTVIRAPIDGAILRRFRKSGEVVSPQTGTNLIILMADTSRLRVRVDVDETDVAKLAVGQRVSIKADAYGNRRFGGVVTRVGQMLGAKSVRTDEPTEKNDTKVLQTLVDLDSDVKLPIGLRVDVFIQAMR